MKLIDSCTSACAFLAIFTQSVISETVRISLNLQPEEAFQQWQNKYQVSYPNDEIYRIKKNIFIQNFQKINDHNRLFYENVYSYKLELNQFSDQNDQEFAEKYLMQLPYPEEEMQFECPYKYLNQTIPSKFKDNLDWRNATMNPAGVVAVTPVKNQASCGSCYAFSAMASMESSLCMNKFVDNCGVWNGLSEQQVLDCGSYNMKYDSTDREYFGYGGCNGGWQSNVWQYIYWNRGVMSSDDYPYVSGNSSYYPNSAMNVGECMYNAAEALAIPDKIICGTTNKDGADAKLMKEALASQGALAIGMYVNGTFRNMGKDGIYDNTEDCPDLADTGINHAMTVVGYGQNTNGTNYWIVKNSWGTDFADNGYVKVVMGENMCGIEGNVQYTDSVMAPVEVPDAPDSGHLISRNGVIGLLSMLFYALF